MKKVIVFRSELLARSETFIKEQARFPTSWHPILLGYRTLDDGDGLDLAGLDVHLIPGLSSGLRHSVWLRVCQWLGKPHDPTVRAFRAFGASLVHTHFGTDATDVWPSVKAAGLPMVVTLHGYDINIRREWWEAGHGGLRRRVYPRRLLRMAREPNVHFIAVSKAIKARALEYGIPEAKLSISYIGVDTERFQPAMIPLARRRKRILFVGRMVEKKAPLLMIRAFAEVRKAIPDAELAMIGNGPLFEDVRRLAMKLDVPVLTLGSCNSDQVHMYMKEARVFCLPSVVAKNGDAEGLPISILEAQASGLPVVTSARGAVGEVITNGENGFVVHESSVREVANALLEILSSDGLWHLQSTRALELVRARFSISNTIHSLTKIYTLTQSSTDAHATP